MPRCLVETFSPPFVSARLARRIMLHRAIERRILFLVASFFGTSRILSLTFIPESFPFLLYSTGIRAGSWAPVVHLHTPYCNHWFFGAVLVHRPRFRHRRDRGLAGGQNLRASLRRWLRCGNIFLFVGQVTLLVSDHFPVFLPKWWKIGAVCRIT